MSSQEFIKNHLSFKNYLGKVDYIITGEGEFDSQSRFGKGAGSLIELFKEQPKVIYLVCGSINKATLTLLLKNVYPIDLSKFFSNKNESITNYRAGIEKACNEIIKELNF